MATQLSVNINKVALLRNSRGGPRPNLLQVMHDCIAYGAQGITVHPRPDERHIRRQDVRDIAAAGIGVEFNVEGYPSEEFMQLVLAVKPAQVTLVPDPPGTLTSDAGWPAERSRTELVPIIERLKAAGIRTSVFVDTVPENMEGAAASGTDRVELYTGPYAEQFAAATNDAERQAAVAPYVAAGEHAARLGLGLNAGHDLDQHNLRFFVQHVPQVLEVSIGHALVCDALYDGLDKTIKAYRKCLGA